MQASFYRYQQRRVRMLSAWGMGSVLAGAGFICLKKVFWKQFGWQMLLWGAIDALIVVVALRFTRRKIALVDRGELEAQVVNRDVRNLRRLALFNTCLDVGYVTSGVLVARRARDEGCRGMGIGIILQGTWLLCFDSWLSWDIKKRWYR
jgi:hypothetical protein